MHIPLSIRQDESFKRRFFAKVSVGLEDQCWPWLAAKVPAGYGKINYNGKLIVASRASFVLFWGEIPDGFDVCHECDNPPCVNPWHLTAKPHIHNVRDMISRKRHSPPPRLTGESNGFAKLTEDDVRLIRSSSDTAKALARSLNVSIANVCDIRNGKRWAHVE